MTLGTDNTNAAPKAHSEGKLMEFKRIFHGNTAFGFSNPLSLSLSLMFFFQALIRFLSCCTIFRVWASCLSVQLRKKGLFEKHSRKKTTFCSHFCISLIQLYGILMNSPAVIDYFNSKKLLKLLYSAIEILTFTQIEYI